MWTGAILPELPLAAAYVALMVLVSTGPEAAPLCWHELNCPMRLLCSSCQMAEETEQGRQATMELGQGKVMIEHIIL